METIHKIYKDTDFSDPESVKKAQDRMRAVSEAEIQFHLVLRDTDGVNSQPHRRQIALAQQEQNRRATQQANQLAYRTTLFSGAIGLFGVVLGFVLATFFTSGGSALP